ncbi:PAS domain S-box protein [Hwanghaeella grinnelliae]|uniref:PAS domain S-box protein n=1 Tax=Hwanghaeella grinnelliae TaxID=2500179 RepID=A0A437QWZ5_9PROT|nr:PAS domain-containing protein [Hwanghaeella grinnelliae]RVU39058.1 PAS domain S-box protein [Hwanghaeella grinnelliae]
MSIEKSNSLTGHERKMRPDQIIVTKTDLSGKIRYGNRTFFEFSDYSGDECIGKQHNLIRHPDMPRTVFDLLWKTIAAGNEIFAYVNNRSKNGDNYWVLAHVTPSRDSAGSIIGYHSNRRAPNRDALNEHIIPLYQRLLKAEQAASSPKAALADGAAIVDSILRERSMSFNQFMFFLGV